MDREQLHLELRRLVTAADFETVVDVLIGIALEESEATRGEHKESDKWFGYASRLGNLFE